MSGTSAPYSALFTKRKSPISRVFSMLPDGIRKASTRKVRRKNQTTSATTIDLVHSHSQITAERERSAGRPCGAPGRPGAGEVEELVERAVMPWFRGERETTSITPRPASFALAQGGQHLRRVLGRVGHPCPPASYATVRPDPESGPDHPNDFPAVHRLLAPGAVSAHDLAL